MGTHKKLLTMTRPLGEIITRPEILVEARQIAELQSWLMGISEENLSKTVESIIESIFVSSEDYVEKLARNIFFAARFRAMAIESLSSLVVRLLDAKDKFPHVTKLKDFLTASFIEAAFHDEFCYKETWRYFFLYHLMKRGAYSELEVVKLIEDQHKSQQKSDTDQTTGLHKIMAVWFAPEIEKHAPELWRELANRFFGGEGRGDKAEEEKDEEDWTRVFGVLQDQGITLEVLRQSDWALLRRSREIGYTADPLVEALIRDDVDELCKQSAASEFDVNVRIEPSLFSRSTILQDSSTPLFFSAAVGAVNCFKFLMLNKADLEIETWNDYDTTLASFAVAGGNNAIVRLVKQAGLSFDDAVYVAAQYHRNSIFHWIYDSLNMEVDKISPRYGSLIHRAAKSNNVELALYLFEEGCDINRPTPNHDFFEGDLTPPLSEAIQFRAIDVARLCLVHKDLTLVQQEEKQDSLIFEMIYYPNHEILPLFLQHKTLASALTREKNCSVLLARCKEFRIPEEVISYFNEQLGNANCV